MRARTTLWAAFACQAACQRQYEPGTPWIIAAGSAPEGDADEGDGAEADDGVGSDVDGGADPAGGEVGSSGHGDDGLDDGGGEVSSSGAPEMPPTPYQGGWDIGGCQSEVTGATDDPGGAISDFSFTDQFGETVRLYDFCHKAVLIVEGAFW